LSAGQYSFPFAVELPNWLQSSFVYTHGYPDQSKHRLKYKLRAKIIDGTCNQKPMHPMISKKMLVISRIPDNPRFNVSMQLEGNVKTLFFVKQGSSKVHVTFNRDSFFIGE
jgi:hypothetical protein